MMDVATLYSTLITNNNDGVDHLRHGRVEIAIGLFKTALQASKALLCHGAVVGSTPPSTCPPRNDAAATSSQQQVQDQDECVSTEHPKQPSMSTTGGQHTATRRSDSSRTSSPSSSGTILPPPVTSIRDVPQDNEQQNQDEGSAAATTATTATRSFLPIILNTEDGYICAMLSKIPPTSTIKVPYADEDDHEDWTLKEECSLTCLVNLAIATHIQALDFEHHVLEQEHSQFHRGQKEQCLRQIYQRWDIVIKMYELTYKILMRLHGDNNSDVAGFDEEYNVNTMMIYMMIVNNLGIIHKHRREMELSHHCFQRLLSIVVYLKECGIVGNGGVGRGGVFENLAYPTSPHQPSPYDGIVSFDFIEAFFSNAINEVILTKNATAPSA